MANYYDALVSKWATLSPGTAAAKLAQINALTVQTAAQGSAFVTTSQVLNTIVSADFLALTQLQLLQLTLLLSGGTIDASKGSSIRSSVQSILAGKTQSLTNLAALVASADSPLTIPWWQATVAQGGGGLSSPVNDNDLKSAGNLT